MGLYRINGDRLEQLESARFSDHAIRERQDLQRMLRESIEAVDPSMMVIAEEFNDWEDSRRRIDLLCLDEDARLVVVELKRTEDGGHMDLQAVRYAAMVSLMTFPRLVHAHQRYLERMGSGEVDAERRILDFLGWEGEGTDELPEGNEEKRQLISNGEHQDGKRSKNGGSESNGNKSAEAAAHHGRQCRENAIWNKRPQECQHAKGRGRPAAAGDEAGKCKNNTKSYDGYLPRVVIQPVSRHSL